MTSKRKPKKESTVRNIAWRISAKKEWDHDTTITWWEEQQNFLKARYDNYIYQLENSWLEWSEAEIETWKTTKCPKTGRDRSGDTHNYHIQGYGHKKKKTRASTQFKILSEKYPGYSIYCEPAKTLETQALKEYCMKPKSRVLGPVMDAELYCGEDLIKEKDFVTMQKTVYRLYKSPPTARPAIWFYCPHGASGKSAIAKFMTYHHGVPLFTYAKAWDLLKIASEMPNRKMYMLNLSKSKPSDVGMNELYSAIESIKDGHFMSTKGTNVKTVIMKPCHFVVFANQLPNMEAMAQKRFRVVFVDPLPNHLIVEDDFDLEADGLREMSEEEVRAAYIEQEQKKADQAAAISDMGKPKKKRRLNKLIELDDEFNDDYDWDDVEASDMHVLSD